VLLLGGESALVRVCANIPYYVQEGYEYSPGPPRGALSCRASLYVPGGFRSSCICAVTNKSRTQLCDNFYVPVHRELFIIASPVILYTQRSLAGCEDSWQ
jgi:hypothetical protein